MRTITPLPHLVAQAAAKGIDMAVVTAVLANPALTYGSFTKDAQGNRVPHTCKACGAPQKKWTGEAMGVAVCIAVNECCGTAVTVWRDQVETPLRPDQRAKGVRGYQGRDGGWRS